MTPPANEKKLDELREIVRRVEDQMGVDRSMVKPHVPHYYGRWAVINRRAPRLFLLLLTLCTAGAVYLVAKGHFHQDPVISWFFVWCAVIGSLIGGWPRLKEPERAAADRHGRTAGQVIGFIVAHHIIRSALRHRKHESIGR